MIECYTEIVLSALSLLSFIRRKAMVPFHVVGFPLTSKRILWQVYPRPSRFDLYPGQTHDDHLERNMRQMVGYYA